MGYTKVIVRRPDLLIVTIKGLYFIHVDPSATLSRVFTTCRMISNSASVCAAAPERKLSGLVLTS